MRGQAELDEASASESGRGWYKIPKVDHVSLNFCYIQEHVGQFRDRLFEAGIDQKSVTKRLLRGWTQSVWT